MSKTKKVCPSCGAVIEGEFCTECGEVIEDEPMTVTLSGEEIAAISYAWARLRMRLNKGDYERLYQDARHSR